MKAGEFLKIISDEKGPLQGFAAGRIETMSHEDFMELCEDIKQLIHHQDTTVGLWATDRPDLVNDPQQMLFEIK